MEHVLRIPRKSEDGQAMVELALVLPFVLVILFAIISFARAANYWNDQTHLANLAARYASVGTVPATGSCGGQPTLQAFVVCQATGDSKELAQGCQTKGCTGSQGAISVCISVPNEPKVGEPVTVKVSSNYNWLPFPKLIGMSKTIAIAPITIVGSATMRLEQITPATTTSIRTTASTC